MMPLAMRVFIHVLQGLLQVTRAYAQEERWIEVRFGSQMTLWELAQSIIDFATGAIISIATVMFLVGAFMIVLTGVQEEYKQKGKNMIIGSLISIAVVLGAYAIFRMTVFFLQG